MKLLQAIGALFFLASVAQASGLQVRDGYVREMPPGQLNTAAFMRLQNNSDKPVEIIAAESDRASTVELHRHVHAGGMMRMEPVAKITVPAQGEFVFKSGEYHVMLLGVKQPAKAGESFPLLFITQSGARIAAQLPVRPIVVTQPLDTHQGHEKHTGHHDHH
jgi:copper(I)-binding protein